MSNNRDGSFVERGTGPMRVGHPFLFSVYEVPDDQFENHVSDSETDIRNARGSDGAIDPDFEFHVQFFVVGKLRQLDHLLRHCFRGLRHGITDG